MDVNDLMLFSGVYFVVQRMSGFCGASGLMNSFQTADRRQSTSQADEHRRVPRNPELLHSMPICNIPDAILTSNRK